MNPPANSPNSILLLWVLGAVLLLIFLVSRWKLHAFVGIILAAVVVGLGSGMPLPSIARSFQEGVGSTLGFIAVVVGLGTMLGKMFAASGGAQVVAERMIGLFGKAWLPWSLMLVSFVVGFPVFFGVGVVLLIPILRSLSAETGKRVAWLGIPVLAGLSASHGLVPPHPGPMVAIDRFGADVGKSILYGILVGLPAAALAGPVFLKWIGPRMGLDAELTFAEREENGGKRIGEVESGNRPGFWPALLTILIPLGLMFVATMGTVLLPKGNGLRSAVEFIGSPLVAMLVAVLLSLELLGRRCGMTKEKIAGLLEESVGPAASIFLVVGAGGGFSKVLDVSGAAVLVGDAAKSLAVSPYLLGWLVASLIRVAVGSATVAITMAAAILAPIVQGQTGVNKELLVVAMGAGSLILSHLNDGGFWFVKEYLGFTVNQTLRSWTVLETILSVAAMLFVWLLSLLV